MKIYDFIIVGSGASGVTAAYPLSEKGHSVAIVDVGIPAPDIVNTIPSKDFLSLRQQDKHQHRYFLGDEFEGIPLDTSGVGTKLTPPRLYVLQTPSNIKQAVSSTFRAHESYAAGGAASSWGAGALPLLPSDYGSMPISHDDLETHYSTVMDRIGVSGADDDLSEIYGYDDALLPPLDIDRNAEVIYECYKNRADSFKSGGFFMGRTRLAVCSVAHQGRGPHKYYDMDYWADIENSVFRPIYILDKLKKFPNFEYVSNQHVLSFTEKHDGMVEIICKDIESKKTSRFYAKTLILCAGALGTARIVLRSLAKYNAPIPILSNPYSYIPTINLRMFGQIPKDKRCSLSQLAGIYKPDESGSAYSHFNVFSYRSLLTFKLLNEIPFPCKEGIKILPLLIPIISIVTVFHSDHPTANKYCILRQQPDCEEGEFEIHYELSPEEIKAINDNERGVVKHFRRLGCIACKRISRNAGGSIHYCGTIPMTSENRELTCTQDGLLRGTKSVYIADGSCISPMPATVPTLTFMANANRISEYLAQKMT